MLPAPQVTKTTRQKWNYIYMVDYRTFTRNRDIKFSIISGAFLRYIYILGLTDLNSFCNNLPFSISQAARGSYTTYPKSENSDIVWSWTSTSNCHWHLIMTDDPINLVTWTVCVLFVKKWFLMLPAKNGKWSRYSNLFVKVTKSC